MSRFLQPDMDHDLLQAGQEAVKQNLQGLIHLLQAYPPFDRMHSDNLQALLSRGALAFYAKDTAILSPDDGVSQHVHIIRQGSVAVYPQQPVAAPVISTSATDSVADTPNTSTQTPPSLTELPPVVPSTVSEAYLGPGDMFALDALLKEKAVKRFYVADEDVFCIIIDKSDFLDILKRSEPLRLFAFRGVSSLFGQIYEQARQTAYEQSSPSISLNAKLAGLVQRPAVRCHPSIVVHEAVALMHREAVTSIVISRHPQGKPEGIFTLRDLRRIVASDVTALQGPMGAVMTEQPICLGENASAFEATMLMAQHHIGHICVMDGETLKGVISERDVFALQRVDLVQLSRQLRYATDKQQLIETRDDIPALVTMMLAHGASASQLMDVVTQLNDHTSSRAIELCLRDHPHIDFDFNWMLFGSEGRGEQTLFSDQDNAMLFEADGPDQAEARRTQLLPLAKEINQLLDACGLAWCKGNVMASNPELCLSLQEWQDKFSQLMNNPSPRHLLESSIYFDLRHLWGEGDAFEQLRAFLRQECVTHTRFQRALARVAVLNKPPAVDHLRSILGATLGTRTSVDLKYQGINPFVNGVRVLALTIGCQDSNTHARIQFLRRKGVFSSADARGYSQAFNYLQLLRMQQHQEQRVTDQPFSNHVEPSRLDPIDNRMLRESLRQARQLQTMIKLRYRI